MSRLRSVTHIRPEPRSATFPSTGPRPRPHHRASGHALLEARPGGAAAAFAARLADHRPLVAFIFTTLAGYVVLAAVAIGAGFLLVDVLVPVHAIGHNDEAVNAWLARERTPSLSDASYVGSSIGDVPFIPALVLLAALVAAIGRHWRAAGLIVGAILVEVATYRVASLIVHRERPTVPRLDHLPVNQSYPSGHVAASVVVYVGLALLLSHYVRSRALLIAVWAVAIALPLVVASSRMYRGMHHPTDALSGALVGLAALTVAACAVRVAGDVARRRESARGQGVVA